MSNLPVSPTFPLEITDMITDFLFDDKSALANMSLVCRAFYPSARRHLFETLTIRSHELPQTTQAQLSDFMEVFTSFASLVRRLRIRGPNIIAGHVIYSLQRWTETFLPCFSVFKDVTSLSLEMFSWHREETDGMRSNLFDCFSGLLELSFLYCTIDNMANITWLALQFPLLERMHFDDVDCEDNSPLEVVPSGIYGLSSLRSVCLGGVFSDHAPIMHWFLSLDRIPPLHSFQITNLVREEFVSVGELLHALGACLRHLTLGFHEGTLDLGVSCQAVTSQQQPEPSV
jgi:hypothetical protein